jgi:hypothetical protein
MKTRNAVTRQQSRKKLPACPIKSFLITETKIHSRVMSYKVNYYHPRWPRSSILFFPGWPIFKLLPWHLGAVSVAKSPRELWHWSRILPSDLVPSQGNCEILYHRLIVFSKYHVQNSLFSYIMWRPCTWTDLWATQRDKNWRYHLPRHPRRRSCRYLFFIGSNLLSIS